MDEVTGKVRRVTPHPHVARDILEIEYVVSGKAALHVDLVKPGTYKRDDEVQLKLVFKNSQLRVTIL